MDAQLTLKDPSPAIPTWKKERKKLFDFVRPRVRSLPDAEDIVQEVLLKFLSRDGMAEAIENIGAWLLTVARNRIIDRYRTRKQTTPLEEKGADDSGALEYLELVAEGNPEDEFEKARLWDEFATALDGIPKEQREVFVWHEMEGKSFKEISRETGIPVPTLLSRKHYAKKFLQQKMAGFINNSKKQQT